MTATIFAGSTVISMASNMFQNVPCIWQHDDVEMIRVVKDIDGLHSVETKLFDTDGTYFGKQKGSHLFLTDDGKKAGYDLRRFPDAIEVRFGPRTILELRKIGAAAVSIVAELNTSTGVFVQFPAGPRIDLFDSRGKALEIYGSFLSDSYFRDCQVGIKTNSDGSVNFGIGGGNLFIGRFVA